MIYIPPGCQTLDQITEIPQIRLGIQGYGNRGKSWAALTFPNPIVANLDRGLGAHIGRADVAEAPFYKDDFCKTIDLNYKIGESKKEIYLKWLETHGKKLSPEQTLVWDGNTPMQNSFHKWFEDNMHKFMTKEGDFNKFAEWKEKRNYYAEVIELLKTLPCHVIFICHEVERPDKPTTPGQPGSYTGKIRPLLSGQFGDEIETHFTDWFRQHCMDKPDVNKMTDIELKLWGLDKSGFKVMCDTFTGNTIYFWQTEGDNVFDAKRSSLVGAPRFIPAYFSSFKKYRRKISSTVTT